MWDSLSEGTVVMSNVPTSMFRIYVHKKGSVLGREMRMENQVKDSEEGRLESNN